MYRLLITLIALTAHCGAVSAHVPKEVPLEIIPVSNDPLVSRSYYLSAPELPKSTYVLYQCTLLNESYYRHVLYRDYDGALIIPEERSEFNWKKGDFGYGEPIILSLTTCDKRGEFPTCPITASKIVIPEPLAVQDAKGHELEIYAYVPDGKQFILRAKGYQPYEEVIWLSFSCNEMIRHISTMDAEGQLHVQLHMGVIGEKEGPFQISIIDKDGDDLTLQHYWGQIAFTAVKDYDKLKDRFGDRYSSWFMPN